MQRFLLYREVNTAHDDPTSFFFFSKVSMLGGSVDFSWWPELQSPRSTQELSTPTGSLLGRYLHRWDERQGNLEGNRVVMLNISVHCKPWMEPGFM